MYSHTFEKASSESRLTSVKFNILRTVQCGIFYRKKNIFTLSYSPLDHFSLTHPIPFKPLTFGFLKSKRKIYHRLHSFRISVHKALVRKKKLTPLALNFCKTLRSTFWAPLYFVLILEFLKVGIVQQNNDILSFNSFLGQMITDISKITCFLLRTLVQIQFILFKKYFLVWMVS